MDGDDAIRRTCPDDGGGEKRQQRRMPDKSTDPSTSKPVRDDAPGIRRRNGRVDVVDGFAEPTGAVAILRPEIRMETAKRPNAVGGWATRPSTTSTDYGQ